MITIDDIKNVCKSLNKDLDESDMNEVLKRYNKIEEYDNWLIMVEDIIYEVISEKNKIIKS